jgi:hypothetical protein
MATQDQYLRQNAVAQQNFEVLGNTQLGNDASDTTTVVGKMTIGGTTVQPVAATNYGPGPLTNEVIFSFTAATYDAAYVTVTVVDDANADIFVVSYAIAHDGTTPTLSSAFGQVDIWAGTDPTFNVNNNAGTIELRMNIADAVSVNVAVDAKLFAAQTSEFITISGQPANDTVVAGDVPGAFVVAASTNDGGTLSYQWQVDDGLGGGFVNAVDGATYGGATTTTLSVTTTDISLNGYDYRCIVSSTGGAAPVTSNTATLTVNAAAVTISVQPSSTTVVEGDVPATFSVTASTNETLAALTYQWQVDSGGGYANVTNDATYAGATTATLTITTTDQSLTTYEYQCVVTSTSALAPTATSTPAAVLTVSAAAVTISVDPASVSVATGNPHTFTVTASTNETLASLTYQWRVDNGGGFVDVTDGATGGGGNYSGATTDSLAIDDVAGLNGYLYQCVVTSDSTIAPTATSAAATLTVT